MTSPASRSVHRRALVVDTHTHGLHMLPSVIGRAYRTVNVTTMPPDTPLEVFTRADVDAAVIKAVGDPAVTRWYRGGGWPAVLTQLEDITKQVADAGGTILTQPAILAATAEADDRGPWRAILGLEGADAIGHELGRVEELHRRNVRVVGLVHLGDNQFGTTSMPWQQYIGKVLPVTRRREPGLTAPGRELVALLNALGIVIDMAHADAATTAGVAEATGAPIISSHTGAAGASATPFARFLSDDELRIIAGTGGVVGLWPYRHRGRGVHDVADLVGHARYVADLVGVEHLCIGTDMNGVPGLMDGYGGEEDLPLVTAALLDSGFTTADTEAILGRNIVRVFGSVAP